jgi:hypothetical protein
VAVRAVATALLLGSMLAAAAPAALAQRTTSDGLLGCERYAAAEFKRRNPAFRRFVIDRASVVVDRFADKVGSQFVATIYYGRAAYDAGGGAKIVRFLCLHGGVERGPLFVYALD